MTSADFPWFWKFVMQSQQSVPSAMVLCIEECLQSHADAMGSSPQLRGDNAPAVFVFINGKRVPGGVASDFPSRTILLDHQDTSARLRLLLVPKIPQCGSDDIREAEANLDACYSAEFAMRDLTAFGSPLYTSLWLGLADSNQDSSLCDCLLRARSFDGPKVKITLFDRASLPSLQSVMAGVLPRPNVRLSLLPSEGDDGSCFSSRASREDPEVTETIQSVDGLIRCLDESNNMIAHLHKCVQAPAAQLEETLQELRLERDQAKCESSNKDEVIHTLRNQLQHVQAKASELHAVQEQAKHDHVRELFQKNECIDTLEKQLELVHGEVGSLQAAHEQTNHTHTQQLRQKNADIEDLGAKLQQCLSQVTEVKAVADQEREKYSQEVQHKNSDIATLEKQLQQARRDIGELQAAQDHAQQSHRRELHQKDGYISAVEKQVQQAHAQVVNLQHEQDRLQTNHSNTVQQKNDDIEALNKQLQRVRAQVGDLQAAQETAYANHARETLQKNEYIESLQKQLQQVHSQVANMQTAQEEAQEKHSREVMQKNEDIDAHQKQLRQVHAYVTELQTAQEQSQQNHSREVSQKTEDMALLQKQLHQVRGQVAKLQATQQRKEEHFSSELEQKGRHIDGLEAQVKSMLAQIHDLQASKDRAAESHLRAMSQEHAATDAIRLQLQQVHAKLNESEATATRCEETMYAQSRNADEIIQWQQGTVCELEQRLAAAVHAQLVEPGVQASIQEPISEPVVEPVAEPTSSFIREPLGSRSTPHLVTLNSHAARSVASPVSVSAFPGGTHSASSFRGQTHLAIPSKSAPVLVTRMGGVESLSQPPSPAASKPVGEPVVTDRCRSPTASYNARSPVAAPTSMTFQIPTATKAEY